MVVFTANGSVKPRSTYRVKSVLRGFTEGEGVMEERELVIRVVAMPADTNSAGDIFGGWLLSQMDLAAWVCARKLTPHRLVTVALDQVIFHRPVNVGDCVLCYARVEKMGRTSITVHIDALVERVDGTSEEQVTEGRFTLVAIDENRKPVPLRSK